MAPWLIAGAIQLAKEFLPSMVSKVAGDTSGKVAGKVIGMAADIAGAPITDEDSLTHAKRVIAENPELSVQFQTRMAELELEETKAYLEDRQSARERDIELRKQGQHNTRADMMIIMDGVGLIVCLAMLYLIRDIEGIGEIRGIISTIAGFFGLGLRDAHQFEFGSSRGSKDKDALIGGRS